MPAFFHVALLKADTLRHSSLILYHFMTTTLKECSSDTGKEEHSSNLAATGWENTATPAAKSS